MCRWRKRCAKRYVWIDPYLDGIDAIASLWFCTLLLGLVRTIRKRRRISFTIRHSFSLSLGVNRSLRILFILRIDCMKFDEVFLQVFLQVLCTNVAHARILSVWNIIVLDCWEINVLFTILIPEFVHVLVTHLHWKRRTRISLLYRNVVPLGIWVWVCAMWTCSA